MTSSNSPLPASSIASSRAGSGGTCAAQIPRKRTITPPKNKYTPEQDVQLGQKAAAEVREAYPLITATPRSSAT